METMDSNATAALAASPSAAPAATATQTEPAAAEAQVSLPEFTLSMRGYDRLQVEEYIGRLGRWMNEAQARTTAAEQGVAQLQRANAELRRRVTELEEDGGSPAAALEGLGQRIEEMLTEAAGDCEEIRRRGMDEANAAVEAARKTAVDIIERTRATVRQLEEAAKADRRQAGSAHETAAAEAEQAATGRVRAADQQAAGIVDDARQQAEAMLAEAEQRRVRIMQAAEQHRRSVDEDIARLVAQRDHVLKQLNGLRSALEGAISVPDAPAQDGQ